MTISLPSGDAAAFNVCESSDAISMANAVPAFPRRLIGSASLRAARRLKKKPPKPKPTNASGISPNHKSGVKPRSMTASDGLRGFT